MTKCLPLDMFHQIAVFHSHTSRAPPPPPLYSWRSHWTSGEPGRFYWRSYHRTQQRYGASLTLPGCWRTVCPGRRFGQAFQIVKRRLFLHSCFARLDSCGRLIEAKIAFTSGPALRILLVKSWASQGRHCPIEELTRSSDRCSQLPTHSTWC